MRAIIFTSFLISLFFKNVVYGYNCTKELYNINLKDLSVSTMVTTHTSARKVLGNWVYFFFSHFSNPNDAIKYIEDTNIHVLDNKDQSCFVRAFTIFLIHSYANDIKAMSNTENYETFFKNLLKDVNEDFRNDFLSIFTSQTLLSYIDGILPSEQDILNLKNDAYVIKNFISKSNRKTHATYHSSPLPLFTSYGSRLFRSNYLPKEDLSISMNEILIARDFNFLSFIGVSDMYYNSDITLPARGTSAVIDHRKKLGFRKRSSSLLLYGPHNNNPAFSYCEKDGKEEYFGSVDDLLPSFFSIIKTKMVYGHRKFLREFDYSLIHKSYSVPNLKGLRFIKNLFKKKNLENFVGMYSDLMSTELDFLTEDFAELFDITMNCHAREFFGRAGNNYYALKGRNIES
ncbi:rhoptry-associated protein 2 [Plasmodium gonderi]|uniref:Rhoptry-associated protein 2 n=1 Tax=Plasmodium gonderi TaxID=77519 RepID=A0A1Y1JG98_PLAGO|nr:rhoptry-associated protein 2 [Plasmodium gonderi]GAW81549.1 rhoptry-associated protein 2 [Plasmodium gonderi]